jgi:acetyl esterase/lipase
MNIKAVIAAYPVLDVTSPFFSKPYDQDKMILGQPSPPASLLTEYLTSIKPGTVSTCDETRSKAPIMLTIINQGRYFEILSRDALSEEKIARVQPIRNLERVQTEKIPFLFVYHGKDDTGVPVEGTHAFEKRLRELHPTIKANFVYEQGEHGFDRDASLETDWLQKGLEEVGKYWPVQ